jgi:hypothetical protein
MQEGVHIGPAHDYISSKTCLSRTDVVTAAMSIEAAMPNARSKVPHSKWFRGLAVRLSDSLSLSLLNFQEDNITAHSQSHLRHSVTAQSSYLH